LITTDQQRFDTLHCNGSDFIRTPNLDRLAEAGVRFERCYCSNPVCTPSRVSLMTGMQVSEHGSYNIGTITNKTEIFLSSILTKAGYRTHHIGKAHFYPSDVPSEENKICNGMEPFHNFAGFETAELTVGHNDWGVSGHYKEWLKVYGLDKEKNLDDFKVNLLLNRDTYANGIMELPMKFHSSSWIVDRTKHFLSHHDLSQPFFLNIGFQDPHHPHVIPKDFNNRLNMDGIPRPRSNFDVRLRHMEELYQGRIEESRFSGRYRIAGNQNTKWCDYFEDTEKTTVTRRQYYSMVQLLDEQIGKLITMLKDYGVLDHTIFIFTSDHGEMLGDHKLGQKGPLAFEEVVRVPLLISYMKIKPAVITDCVSLVDIYPTVLDYIGIEPHSGCAGFSMKPLFCGGHWNRTGVRIEFKEEKDAIRYKCYVNSEWKLVLYLGEEFGELYHLSDDPGEDRNLFYEDEFVMVKLQLMKELLEDMDRCELLNDRPSRC
jgi:arylsulfatase A-like enzyme